MATNIETMWVGDTEQLHRTVQNLVSRGGVVQAQSDTEVTLFIKKKMNVVVLVVGLVLCLLPGLAYLIWYTTADQNQQVTVKVGTPTSIRTDHQHWYDSDGTEPADPGTVPTGSGAAPEPSASVAPGNTAPGSPPGYSAPSTGVPAPPAPAGLGTPDPLSSIPPMPTAAPEEAPVVPPPPAPPAPPAPPSGSSF